MNHNLGTDATTSFTFVTQNPNGTLAGVKNDKAFDTVNNTLYICTATGDISTAVWTAVVV